MEQNKIVTYYVIKDLATWTTSLCSFTGFIRQNRSSTLNIGKEIFDEESIKRKSILHRDCKRSCAY